MISHQSRKNLKAHSSRLEVLRESKDDDWSDLGYEIMFDRKIPYINFNNEEN